MRFRRLRRSKFYTIYIADVATLPGMKAATIDKIHITATCIFNDPGALKRCHSGHLIATKRSMLRYVRWKSDACEKTQEDLDLVPFPFNAVHRRESRIGLCLTCADNVIIAPATIACGEFIVDLIIRATSTSVLSIVRTTLGTTENRSTNPTMASAAASDTENIQ